MIKAVNKRIAFFGGKPLSVRCLEALFPFHGCGDIEIVAVLPHRKGARGWWSGPAIPEMAETAEALSLPIIDSPEALLSMEVDLGISVLHSKLLEPEVFTHPSNGFVNLHGAPLPHYRGCNVCTHAIQNGESRFGATLHQLDEKVDHGELLGICWFDMDERETARTLMSKTERAGLHLFKEMLVPLLENRIAGRSLAEIATHDDVVSRYYPRDSVYAPDFKRMQLDWQAERIDRHVRSLDFPPFEPAYFEINGRRIYATTGFPGEATVPSNPPSTPMTMEVIDYTKSLTLEPTA